MKFMNYGEAGAVAAGFYAVREEDEFLKPVAAGASFEAIETQYFGFNIPEHGINGEVYIWHHPVLKVTSGGFLCWKGPKTRQLGADYQDYRWFMPMPDRTDVYSLPNGVSVRFIAPLQAVEIGFSDPSQATSLQMTMTAIMPPAGRGNGGHFTQAMRTQGTLVLHGQTYPIDGFYTRDHSWGEFRTEAPMHVPPLSWIAGVFDADFAFHLTAFDSSELHPDWRGKFETPEPGQNLRWGYVWRDGALKNIVSCRKFTHRAADGVMPRQVDLDLVDGDGRSYRVTGTAVAPYPWMAWANMHCAFSLTRWECDGRVGWGDIQDCIWNPFMRQLEREAA